MRTIIIAVAILALLALAACGQNATDDASAKYAKYCGAAVDEVYDCGEYVKGQRNNLGGGSRWYDAATSDYMDCPVVGPDSMTPGCKALMERQEAGMECTKVLDCADVPRQDVAESGVEKCPEGYDSYSTQNGMTTCIRHLGVADFEQMQECGSQSECASEQSCILTVTATDGTPITDAKFRCVPQSYTNYRIQSGGARMRDKNGQQEQAIA